MQTKAKDFITPEEYLETERKAEFKSEYFAGEMFALAGAKKNHILIITNIVRELSSQLKDRPCEVYSNDMRVKVSEKGLYTYPDVVVVCGESKFEDEITDTLLNPTLIIEVLSESTEAYDRGRKFEHYRNISSLMEYLLISLDHYKIEKFQKQEDGKWIFSEEGSLEETMDLPSTKCTLSLKEVYDKVDLSS